MVSQSPCLVITVMSTPPLDPWITLTEEAVACFQYLAKCLRHECLGHPNKGPLYAAGALPSELQPALQGHLREYFRGRAVMAPHWVPTAVPNYPQQRTKHGVWLHDLLLLATIQGTTVQRLLFACSLCVACAACVCMCVYVWVCARTWFFCAQCASWHEVSRHMDVVALLSYHTVCVAVSVCLLIFFSVGPSCSLPLRVAQKWVKRLNIVFDEEDPETWQMR